MLNIVSPFEISVISQVDWNIYVDREGPSGVMHDDPLLPDPPHDYRAPSLPNDDAGAEGNVDTKVYGLSNLRQSRWIAKSIEKISQQRWGSNASVHFVNNRESDEEEEEDIEEDDDFDIASDEGLEGYEDDDELFAEPGQEGILLWDSLGEGFLREASQLGMSFWYYYFKFLSPF